MKRIIFILLSILVVAACDIDINFNKEPDNTDNSENLESGSPSEETPLERELICGTWKIICAKYSEDAQLTEWEHEDTYATFKENGIYKGRDIGVVEKALILFPEEILLLTSATSPI